MNAFTRKRPTPGGLIAKLHSFVDSNSAACLSFITLRTSSIVCCDVIAVFDTGVILPSTLIAGGNAAVMNRSEPRSLTISTSSSWMNRVACSRSMVPSPVRTPPSLTARDALSRGAERFLADGAHPRLARRDHVAPHEIDQV